MTRRIAAFSIFALTLSLVAMPSAAWGMLFVVDPDDFAAGSDLTNAFPPLTLTVEGRPTSTVIARDGFSDFNGRNLATTGDNVFGYEPTLAPVTNGKVWDENTYGRLRVDFRGRSVDWVQIDLIFDDDDIGGLWAFDRDGNLLDSFIGSGDGRGPIPFLTATVEAKGIAYVLAGGVNLEGHFLDNLKYNVVPEPSTLALLVAGLLAVAWRRVTT